MPASFSELQRGHLFGARGLSNAGSMGMFSADSGILTEPSQAGRTMSRAMSANDSDALMRADFHCNEILDSHAWSTTSGSEAHQSLASDDSQVGLAACGAVVLLLILQPIPSPTREGYSAATMQVSDEA